MTPSSFLVPRAATVLLAFALAWPAVASAQDDAFRRGLEARGDKNWKAVVTHMQEAIKSDSKESTRKVGGGLFRQGMEYLPHYFLGEAFFNQQLCARAVEEWWISEQLGVVRARREFVDTIANGYKTCAAAGVLPPPEFNQQQVSTTQAVTEATALAERLSKQGQANYDAWRPEMQEQFTRATGELTAAQARLAAGNASRAAAHFAEARAAAGRATTNLRALESALSGNIENLTVVRRQTREVDQLLILAAENGDRAIDNLKAELPAALGATRQNGRTLLARARERVRAGEKMQNLATVNDALRSAQDAMGVFNDILDQVNKLARGVFERELAEVVAAATEALSFVDSSFATLQRLAAEKASLAGPDVVAKRDALQKRVSALRRRFDTAQKTENVNGLKETARLAVEARTELDALITAFGPVTLKDRGVHAALEEGARLFFAGDYQKVVAALESSTLDDAPLQVHVHLFRAAALYNLFVRSGEKDQALRTRAVAEVDLCKRLNPAFTPDARAFAPRFLQFFQKPAGAATP